jgi:transglutaminase-like putative cysteine protease
MRYQATHLTSYKYEAPVAQCLSEARLTPRTLPWQTVSDFKIAIDPSPVSLDHRQDYFGNEVTRFSIFRTHDQFTVTSTSLVEVLEPPKAPSKSLSWEEARIRLAAHIDAESMSAYEFCFDSPFVPALADLAAYARPSFPPGRPLVEAAADLSRRIHKDFSYKPHSTSIDMPLADVLIRRRGVCQDFSHVMIGALRSYHLAARYVSGYLRSGATYLGAEASHAWVSVYIPDYGWLDLDPTNDVRPTTGHVTVAYGRDYGDVTPVKGISLGGGEQTIGVEVRVTPLKDKE